MSEVGRNLGSAGLGIVVLCAALGVVGCAFDSRGAPIDAASRPSRALLVLDVQEDFTGASARMPVDPDEGSAAIANINALTAHFAAAGDPVVYVRNVFPRSDFIANLFRRGAAVEGGAGIAYDARLERVAGPEFSKSVPDMFSNHELEAYLADKKIGELVMTGVFADQCVFWSSRSALNRGFRVVYVPDAVATANESSRQSAVKRITSFGARAVPAASIAP